ncbi:MAG: hypothetical protein NTY02_03610, partial [Acidobacteria bacterium]|nr:hypothetical protein [Acidobacteriota bacterium]
MPDAWETAQGLNPGDPDDAWRDPDGDGVANLFEYQLGSDPRSPATPLVKTVGATGANYTSVATALNAAARGTVIRVAGGSYLVNYVASGTKVVMIQGGWSPDFRQRDLRLYPTEFDGAMRDEILYFSPGSGESTVVLDGLRFVRGNGFFGAVNFLASGSAVMRTSILNCSITNSSSTFSSGSVLNMFNWGTSTADRTIANTVIGANQASGIYSQMTDSGTARWRFINATISRNANGGRYNGYGIDVLTNGTATLTAHAYNSIFWGNAQSDIDSARNVIFDVDHADIGRVTGSGAVYRPGAGVVNTDPQFVNAANGDFHLASSSPVIDGGINRGLPLTDFEGDPRIVGALADMGADEQLQGGTRAPGAPTGLTASASGSNIALTWTAPSVGSATTPDDVDEMPGDETTGGAPTAYTIEAGSSPGLANLANFSTG